MRKDNPSTTFEQFSQFIQRPDKLKTNLKIPCALKYTRVSGIEQFKTNGSIESQNIMCDSLATKMNLPLLAAFGGTYESAKTEERKEFKRMMQFIEKSRENIKYIIVSDVDRFSRTGPNAIYLAQQLREKGIHIIAASSPVDTSTPIGEFQQNMQLIFAHYDNQQRREKTIRGMKLKSEKGYFFSTPPMGYQRIRLDQSNKIIINKTGAAIRKAFHWKGDLGLRTSEIAKRLRKSGINIREKQLSRIFRNVFYCGLLSNALLEEKIVEGINWEPLVSKSTFLKANSVLKSYHPARMDRKKENEAIPLKGFVTCTKCGCNWTGYLVNAKGLYYYKCNTKGCKCNRSADKMHEEFKNYLQQFEVKKNLMPIVKKKLVLTFEKFNNDLIEKSLETQNRSDELKKKIESLEIKFIESDIDRDLYQKYRQKYEVELNENEAEKDKYQNELSNPKEFVDFSVKLCSNLSKLWASGGLKNKMKVQQVVFPDGIGYDRENECYRTTRVNSIFAQIAQLTRVSGGNKKGNSTKFLKNSLQVPRRGIEPLLPP